MKHATRPRLVLPLALAAFGFSLTAPATAHADGPDSGTGAPVFLRAKLASIGDVQARSRAVAGTVHPVDAPSTARPATVSAAPRRRTSAGNGAREMNELLADHRSELAACVPGDADPAGIVLLKAHVGADGRTVSVDIAGGTGVASTAATCLAAATAKVTFTNHGARAALVPLRLHVSEIVKTDAPEPSNASDASH